MTLVLWFVCYDIFGYCFFVYFCMMSKGENLLALHTTYTCAFTCYVVQRNIDSIQKLELFTILQKEEFVRIKRFDCFEECQRA